MHNVKASAKLDTVLITVQVRDESPVTARDIANTLSDEFVTLVVTILAAVILLPAVSRFRPR